MTTIITIKGTFDQEGVERYVSDMANSVDPAIEYTLNFDEEGLILTTPLDDAPEELVDLFKRVMNSYKYPFRKTYTGTFRPESLAQELAAIGVTLESCTETEAHVYFETGDDGMPEGFEDEIDDVITNHNAATVPPEQQHRQDLLTTWDAFAGEDIATLTTNQKVDMLATYLCLTTDLVDVNGTIRSFTS